MEKLLIKKLIKIISLISFLFISGCKIEKNFSEKNKIYLEKMMDYSDQPQLIFFLTNGIREVILKYQGFTIVNSEEEADYSLKIEIEKFERIPLFFSKEDSNDIAGAKFDIEWKVKIKEKGEVIFEKNLNYNFSFPTYRNYEEEKILNEISEKIARMTYYVLMDFKNGEK